MWAVVELRGGDIVQTHALYVQREHAQLRLLNLMLQYQNQPDAWWKIVEVPPALHNPNVSVGERCSVVVECDWEHDNRIRIVGIYGPNQHMDLNGYQHYLIWVDEVELQ
jgi:hypothetical protein